MTAARPTDDAASGALIAPLHGLRAVAAFTVVVAHTTNLTDLGLVGNSGSLGVMLFFALSGFLMAHLYLRRPATPGAVGEYARNRFARVYPLFAVVVVASALLFALFGNRYPFRLTPEMAVDHLLLHGDFMTLWTVSVEFQFYAIFAVIWFVHGALGRLSDRVLVTGILAAIVALWFRGFNEDRIAIDGYLHIFLAGMLVEQAYRRGRAARIERWAGLLIVPLLVVYLLAFFSWTAVYGGREMYNLVWLVAGVGLLVWAVLVAPDSIGARVLGSRPMIWLGEISFGIYLLHRPVVWIWQSVLPVGTHGYVLFCLTIVGTIVIAWLAHVVIERPCRLALRRLPVTPGGAARIASAAH